jgi:hypothetical protein
VQKLLIIVLVFLASVSAAIAQEKLSDTLSVSLSGRTISVQSSAAENVAPQFTPGNHGLDTSISLTKISPGFYSGKLLEFQRGFGSGSIGNNNVIIYHLSSGIVPTDMSRPIVVKVVVPAGKHLVYHGQIWKNGIAEVKFSDYFRAREFPLIFVDQDKYLARPSRFNRVDSMMVIYCWVDSLGRAKLTSAFKAVDSAAAHIGELAPNFWHKFINNYDGVGYTLTYIINNKVLTGLEHFNAPYSVTVPYYVKEESVYHTLLHSLIGKALMPKEYLRLDGQYQPSDAMFLYEGLVSFLSLRYGEDLTASLPALMFKAKIFPAYDALKDIGSDHQFESYYSKGALSWLDWQGKGLDVDLLLKYWLGVKLIFSERVPIAVDYDTAVKWIAGYNKMLGLRSDYLSDDNLNGGYIKSAFKSLKDRGLVLIPNSQVAQWDTAYVGPYPIKGISSRQPMLPIDGYPVLSAGVHPVYLIDGQGEKIGISPERNNEALRLLFQFPDSLFTVGFSDSSVINLKKKLYFSDGTEYFMYGDIDGAKYYKYRAYWNKLSLRLTLKKEK